MQDAVCIHTCTIFTTSLVSWFPFVQHSMEKANTPELLIYFMGESDICVLRFLSLICNLVMLYELSKK